VPAKSAIETRQLRGSSAIAGNSGDLAHSKFGDGIRAPRIDAIHRRLRV
jgi:hypothetical protein